MSNWFDFENEVSEKIQPRSTQEDALDANTPAICPNDNAILLPYGQNQLICPSCNTVVNPTFEVIKHDTRETTLEELDDLNSGSLEFVENDRLTIRKTKIRQELDEDSLPDYVKDEIERIHYRPGYKTVAVDKKFYASGS